MYVSRSWSSAGNAIECLQCSDSLPLFLGECVQTCPTGYHAKWSDSGLVCEIDAPPEPEAHTVTRCINGVIEGADTPCACTSNRCQACIWDSINNVEQSCFRCNKKFYFFEDACVKKCPAGYASMGTGAVGRDCIPTETLISLPSPSSSPTNGNSECIPFSESTSETLTYSGSVSVTHTGHACRHWVDVGYDIKVHLFFFFFCIVLPALYCTCRNL